MKTVKLSEVLTRSAEYGLTLQAADGSFPPGCNGPYGDPETPVRNTAHWLYLLAVCYATSGDARWKTAGENAIEFLMSPKARPGRNTFHCRNKDGKDKCNGLVGQAWVIEALVKAAEAFDRQDCYRLAEEVFLLHPWDDKVGIWKRVEVDGTVLSYDGTFNHQLWFAAVGSFLKRTPLAQSQAKSFLDKVAARVQLYPNGVIFHVSAMGRLLDYLQSGIISFLQELKTRVKNIVRKNSSYLKSVGYHGFNIYALAMLKSSFPDSYVWSTEIFNKLVTAHRGEKFVQDVNISEYGYRYNISGIEIALAVETFFQDKQEATIWLNRQMKETYLIDHQSLSHNVPDPNTAMARIYQAARLTEDYDVVVGENRVI